ncbi:MAG: hypothetical protein PHS57_03155 [Alphaproteobacteria bacterium]|nr:hypothetical protein [Alphaproteobacteria bacterium]
MLNLKDLKNRLMKIVSSTVSLFIRGRAVETPRFTYVTTLSRKTGGPDPDDFGKIYRDEQFGKEYIVQDLYVKSRSEPPFYAVYTINEVITRPAEETYLDKEEFKRVVHLKPADIDVQEDMISFFKKDCEKEGETFEDRRSRPYPIRGAALPYQTNDLA